MTSKKKPETGGDTAARGPLLVKRPVLDPSQIRRSRPIKDTDAEEEEPQGPQPVTAGPVDKVIELAFNPTRDKIREVTVIDRMQGRLFPQLDMINMMRSYCIEIAYYRMDPAEYARIYKRKKPVQPDAIETYLYRTAQWQKSVAGKNLERATDIALAETEARAGDLDSGATGDIWAEK